MQPTRTLALAALSLLAACSSGSDVVIDGDEVRLSTTQLDITFARQDAVDETYMIFGGVDMEAWVIAGFFAWTSFLVFRFSLPFFVVLGLCVIVVQLMRGAYKRDPFFLPILFRSLLYRRVYAPRPGATELDPARPSLPAKALPS